MAASMLGLILLSTGCKKEDDTTDTGNKKAYEGTFSAHQVCLGPDRNFDMAVTAGTGDTIIIDNFGNITQGLDVTVALLQNNNVTVPQQQFQSLTYSGSGTFSTSTNTYTFKYQVEDLPGYFDSCTVTTVKK